MSVPWLVIPKVDYVEDKKAGLRQRSTVCAKTVVGTRYRVIVARNHARGRTGAGSKSRVAAEHCDARSVLGAPEGHHVLADVAANDLAMLSAAVGQNVLNKIVSKLVTRDCIVLA